MRRLWNQRGKRLVSLLLALVLCLGLLPAAALAEGTTYTQVTSEEDFTTGKYYMVTDTGYAPGVLDDTWVTAVAQADAAEQAVWTLTVNGSTVTMKDANGTYIAPKGGDNNGIASGEYEWVWSLNDESGTVTFKGRGEDTVVLASNKGSDNRFRAYKESTATGNPNGYPYEFTLYKAENGSQPGGGEGETAVAAPQATPQGGTVANGTKITLTSDTVGAQIYYTLDGSEPSSESTLYSEDNQPTITGDAGTEMTLKAIAVLGDHKSAVQTITYTIQADEPVEPQAPIADGDTVAIYAPEYNMALSGSYRGYYNQGTKVTVGADGALSGYTNADIWTVIDNNDGTWSFSYNGQKLGMGDSFSSMPLGEKNDKWVLEEAADGCWYVKNTVRDAYIEWYAANNNWSAYYSIASGSEGMFALKFCQVEDLPEGPEDGPDVSGLEVRATPASGASVETGDTIELTAAAGATIYYTTDGSEPTKESAQYTAALQVGTEQVPAPTSGDPLVIKALTVIPGDGEETEDQADQVCAFTYQAPVTLDGYRLYFGQLHAHTNISDGAGTVEQAFAHASQVENLDFLAVTDHSNSFDNEGNASVDLGTDLTNVSEEWKEGHEAADAVTSEDFVGIYGFEMTWSDGFGHINTFNTPGFESRSNSEFGNKSGSTEGYQNYYDKLVEVEASLSQFNHPGATFGDFQDFSFYDPQVDQRITLIEVGNGEGAISSSGYFPSYEYYTRALDKGWHVAPTNNQDNHKGNWGDSNTARSVVLAADLTRDSIYDAIRNYRVYATEDNDLSILYALNGNAMGSILGTQDNGVTVTAEISDPTDSGDMKVEVIVNGGLSIAAQTISGGSGTAEFRFDSNDYSYYYPRITQADGNIAVTAPVWTGESVNAGISATACDTALVVKGEEAHLSSELYNNSGSDMTVESVVFSVDDKPIYTADVSAIGTDGVIASGDTATVSFPHTFASAGKTTVDVTMTAAMDDSDYTFTSVLQLTVTDESLVTRILVDGTHYNDYVTGYYSGNMGNFTALAADRNAQVAIQQPGDAITAEDLQDVALLVISAPIKKTQNGVAPTADNRFSDEFIDVVKTYVQGGGTVIVCGLADYQDGSEEQYTTYNQINKLLEGIGSTIKVHDDELIDQDANGGQQYRLYFDDFHFDSDDEAVQAALAGLEGSDKVYSSYSGCSVDVGGGEAIVYGHDTTYSINAKAPSMGHEKPVLSASAAYDPETAVVQKGDVVALATEAVGSGRVYVGGTVWLSDFEVANGETNDYGDASYANKTILENILSGLLKKQTVSTIADVRANTTVGTVFTVEGTVTAGNVEPNAFYDTIYIQDETGGINIYPVATTDGTFAVGQRVRVTGSWDQYQGDTELRCIRIEALDGVLTPMEPTELAIRDVDYASKGGLLAKISGKVKTVTADESGAISAVTLTDGASDFRLLFNNYIGYSDESSTDITTFVEEGAVISAVGVVYMDPEGVCLRIRDLSEVVLESREEPDDGPSHGGGSGCPTTEPDSETLPFTDVPDGAYYYDAVAWAVEAGVTSGTAAGRFSPNQACTRAQMVTFLWRAAGAPEPASNVTPFTDLDEGAYYYDAVLWAVEQGITEGTSATTFAPNAVVTRGQTVTLLWRSEGAQSASGGGFTDVAADAYYADAVAWALDQGITTGATATTFRPGDACTRAQIVTFLYRSAV